MIERKPYVLLPELPKQIAKNHIIVRLDELNKLRKTKSGIIMTSGLEDDELDGMEVYHQIDRCGTVVMVSELYFNPKDPNGLSWDTEMEVEIGDKVWIRQIDANVAFRFKLKEGDGFFYYKMVRYDALNVAKRGEKIIPLNGQVLMTQVVEKSSPLIIQPFTKIIADQGIVKYVGKKNKDYKDNYGVSISGTVKVIDNWSDEVDVEPGDKIQYEMIRGIPVAEIFLESDYINTFGEKLKICQRRHVIRKL